MRLRVKWVNGWAQLHGTGPDGKRIRRALRTQDARSAEEARAQVEAKLWRGALYGAEEVVTFEEAALAYVKDGGDSRFIVPLAERLGKKKLREVTPRMIREAARAIYPTAKHSTLNRQGIVPAQAVINYGHKEGWCSPIRVERFPEERPRRRAVGREYIDAMRPHMPERLFALMLYLHQSGRRVSDALALTPADYDGNRIYVHETKNGEPAHVYPTKELAALLATLEPRHGRLFGYLHRSSVYPTLRRAAAKAGVPYLGTHQPGRHSFATALDAEGWQPRAIADAAGWKTTRLVVETYTHPRDAAKRARDVFDKKSASGAGKPMDNPAKQGETGA